MERGFLAGSFWASCSLHALLVLAVLFAVPATTGRGSGGVLSIELRFDPAGLPGAAPPLARVKPPPAVEPAPPPPPKPVLREPVRPSRPKVIEGVRVATREDLRRRRETPPPAPEPALAPVEIVPGPAGGGNPSVVSGLPSANGAAPRIRFARRPPAGSLTPDALGYEGRIFGQRSVRAATTGDAYYGRIHLFADDGGTRDYSEASLFGFNFRHELGNGGVREYQVGRVQTHGAYLVVTDLFPNGRISTMSHTVVMPFPREAPAVQALWDVVEEPSGTFRLRGPGGSALLFDGRNGALRGAQGFVVGGAGATGTPPAVAYHGLHVRIQAVGGNPFLRGRAATVIDADGRRCALSTSDLFAYDGGRRESDMFRFASDREFFSFLEAYCPALARPRPAEVLLAAPARVEKKAGSTRGGGGLLPSLFRAFGGG